MAASIVRFSHDVEEEGFNIVVQSLVVQEELCQKAQVLAVDLEEAEGPFRPTQSQVWDVADSQVA